ncbi:hypothetical protein LOK49_LG01G01160 [Camellia lanceoleosa]|uniref:Uncharacterized protein n=1 Tax=Camellia lanceoleosa TaxID=1840588 RepID=A0ACC0IU22_9ERIC|nr:hypothetical protein LOK49_LG01G01160 [Camellia lanceoleosa]
MSFLKSLLTFRNSKSMRVQDDIELKSPTGIKQDGIIKHTQRTFEAWTCKKQRWSKSPVYCACWLDWHSDGVFYEEIMIDPSFISHSVIIMSHHKPQK